MRPFTTRYVEYQMKNGYELLHTVHAHIPSLSWSMHSSYAELYDSTRLQLNSHVINALSQTVVCNSSIQSQ